MILLAFIRYALAAIGWGAEIHRNSELVATDLHGVRYRITVTPCE
jgi:hypothetical protein